MVVRSLASLLKITASILGIAVAIVPTDAFSQNITVLTGTPVTCSSDPTEGHPEFVAWFVTAPGEQPGSKPISTDPSFDLVVDRSGAWEITLDVFYAHLDDQSSPWRSSTKELIIARSIVADLAVASAEYTTSETIDLDGTASQIATAATARFLANGSEISGCVFTGVTDPASLVCSVAAADLGEGTHILELELVNSDETDTDSVTISVADPPPFSVDFTWLPVNPDPDESTQFNISVATGYTIDDLATMSWWWDDGSAWFHSDCPPPYLDDCSTYSHRFPEEDFYDVILEVTTLDGQNGTATHEVQVGSPPIPPTANGTALPNPASLRQSILFTFTGSCEDVCTYSWDFGDGTTSTSRNANHFYTRPGTKSVTIEVTNSQGSDSKIFDLPVNSCWTPPGVISQTGSCYGSAVALTAPTAAAWIWDTFETTQQILISQPADHWVNLEESGNACWAYLDHTAIFDACSGTPHGNVDMDSSALVNAADISALLRELTDGDGDLVIDMGAGDLGAPGADLAGTTGPDTDGHITVHDHEELIKILFAGL
ncbi:MAG: PKD domain-containing protein [Thermoanaerobaculales bacterium]|nr:PKD domain-containing protein [Thermoanaerobaculales bacterium]